MSRIGIALTLAFLASCGGSVSGDKKTKINRDELEAMSSGMSMECVRELRLSDRKKLDKQLEANQVTLAQMGVLTPIEPTIGVLGSTDRVVADRRGSKANFPKPTVDILSRLHMTVENEYDGSYGITEEAIRGFADASYGKLGIADESIKGWTLSIRRSDAGANTQLDAKRKVAIIMISVDEFLVGSSPEHELTHVLTGTGFTQNDNVVRIAQEFVAIAGETKDPPMLRSMFTFERANLAILGMARSVDGKAGFLHANNAPLDGLRYDLLRMTDEVIGEDGQAKLAKNIYQYAKDHDGNVTMTDMKKLFEDAGIKNLALFQETLEPGLYLDLGFQSDGTPFVLAKTVDDDGYEGITQTPMQIIWRDAEGLAMGGTAEPIPLQPFFPLMGAGLGVPYASSLEVRVGGKPYIFRIGPQATEGVTSTTQATPSISNTLY